MTTLAGSMFVNDPNELAMQEAVAEIRAFLARARIGAQSLPRFVNSLSKRFGLDVATARRLFVSEAKRKVADTGPTVRAPGTPSSQSRWAGLSQTGAGQAGLDEPPRWNERATAEYPHLQELLDDESA